MIPATLQHPLSRLRSRERLLRLAWGGARTLTLVLALLLVACATDWLVDRQRPTPWPLRVGLLVTQAAAACLAGWLLLLRPLLGRLSDADMARRVEEAEPRLQHRLVTAVELGQPGARTEGMSPQLIALVTRQAEEMTCGLDFSAALDRRRLRWSLLLVVPLLLLVLALTLLFPQTLRALLERQLLADTPIPRSVRLSSAGQEVRPSGDPVDVVIRAAGPGWSREMRGRVRLSLEGLPAREYPLEWQQDGPAGEAMFVARIPPSSTPFTYEAWLGDGRLLEPGRVTFEPRPDLVSLSAWAVYPEYCGLRPDGGRYEELQGKGDILGVRDGGARVRIVASKPLASAELQLLTPAEEQGLERVRRALPMTIHADGVTAEVVFDLHHGETAYRVALVDRNGFGSRHPQRQAIALLPDEPPRVELRAERFPAERQTSFLEDTELDGIPAVLGRPIRIAYFASTHLAIDRAQLRYRIIKPATTPTQESPPWQTLPLREWLASEESGPFDPERCVFENTGFLDEVELHAIPSPSPALTRGRLEGGGRFDFKTKTLAGLKVGDEIEYYVEVFDRRPHSLPGTSEIRIKKVVSLTQLTGWLRDKHNETQRIQQLKESQDALMDPTRRDGSD